MHSSIKSKGSNRAYRILYLAPDRILKGSRPLELQKWYSKTYIEELILPALCDPKKMDELGDALNNFEKIFSGLTNAFSSPDYDVLGKVASIWYAFTKTSHASLGPRVGNFAEQLIKYWIESHRRNVSVSANVNVTKYFIERFNASLKKGRRKIDFIIEDKNTHTLSLIELRESEHTGGKTGQESLMDKLTEVLGWLEDPKVKLRGVLKRRGYSKLELSIAVLFAEKDHRILSQENYSEGRFTSLREYILDNRHIGGMFRELLNKHEYELSLDGCHNYIKSKYDENTRKSIDYALKKHRRICLRKENFMVELSILWGDEFFKTYIGKGFCDLISEIEDEIADDIWLFFTITINEAKILKEFNSTNLEKIYEFLTKNKTLLNDFNALYNNTSISTLAQYFNEFDKLLYTYVNQFIQYARNNKLELRLLETNDILKQYNYLKQLCIAALALYKSEVCK